MNNENNGGNRQVEDFLTLLRTETTEADCDRCLVQIDAYASSQLNSEPYREQFPWVAQHLDSCVACAEAYAQVYELIWAENNGRLAQPPTIPEPDLSFLIPTPSLWATLQAALKMTQTQITLQLDAALFSLLQPSASPSMARSGEDGRFGQQLLSLTAEQTPEANLPFSLAAYADTEDDANCLVEVTVEPPGLSWPELGGYKIILRDINESQTAVTDDWGIAVFHNIPRAELANLYLVIQLEKE